MGETHSGETETTRVLFAYGGERRGGRGDPENSHFGREQEGGKDRGQPPLCPHHPVPARSPHPSFPTM